MDFEPTSWKCRVGADFEAPTFRLLGQESGYVPTKRGLSDFWAKSPDTFRPKSDSFKESPEFKDSFKEHNLV